MASDAQNIDDLTKVLTLNSTPMYIAFNLDTPDAIIKKLQKALKAARASGKVDNLEQLYGR